MSISLLLLLVDVYGRLVSNERVKVLGRHFCRSGSFTFVAIVHWKLPSSLFYVFEARKWKISQGGV